VGGQKVSDQIDEQAYQDALAESLGLLDPDQPTLTSHRRWKGDYAAWEGADDEHE
jgi:hypothetical protein